MGTASPRLPDFICCPRSPEMALVLRPWTCSGAKLPGPPRVSDPSVVVRDKQRGWTSQPLQVPAGTLSCSPANATLMSLCCVLPCPWITPGAVPALQIAVKYPHFSTHGHTEHPVCCWWEQEGFYPRMTVCAQSGVSSQL